MEWYSETQVELVSALKEDATSSLLVAHVVKMKQAEGIFVVDVEETFLSEPKEKVHASHPQVIEFNVFILPLRPSYLGSINFCRGSAKFYMYSNFIWRRNMEVSVGIKYNGSKTLGGRMTTRVVSCIRGWQDLQQNLEVFGRRASW